MDGVEELLARLLTEWQIDFYARVSLSSEDDGLRIDAALDLTEDDRALLAADPLLRELCEEARETGTIVTRNELRAEPSGSSLSEMGLNAIAVRPVEDASAQSDHLLFGSRKLSSLDHDMQARLQHFSRLVFSYSMEKQQNMHQMRNLVVRLTEAEARERSRIATLLHDDLQQTLAGVKVHVDMAARRANADPYVTGRLATAVTLLEEAIDRSRSLSHELNPPELKRRLFTDVLRDLAARFERAHRLRVGVHAPSDSPVLSDFAKIVTYRAVQELLFNVVKHAHVDEANITVAEDERGLEIVVRDSGSGFDVTEVFESDSPRGLGLVSVRERLEAIGASLEVESLPNAGSTFTIFLSPAAMLAEGALMGRGGESAEQPLSGPKLSVVLVDDHAVIRQGIALLLNEEPDLEVVGEADSGESALSLVDELRPDVVVMDLTMPGMSGDEATRQILARAPQTRVIGLSMHSEREAKERMMEAGAHAYLPKAGPSNDLIAAIREAAGPPTTTR